MNEKFLEKFTEAVLKQPECSQETFRVKRMLWCSEPGWETKQAIDYYADTLTMLCNGDDEHCLELKVSGHVARLPIKNPWKYV